MEPPDEPMRPGKAERSWEIGTPDKKQRLPKRSEWLREQHKRIKKKNLREDIREAEVDLPTLPPEAPPPNAKQPLEKGKSSGLQKKIGKKKGKEGKEEKKKDLEQLADEAEKRIAALQASVAKTAADNAKNYEREERDLKALKDNIEATKEEVEWKGFEDHTWHRSPQPKYLRERGLKPMQPYGVQGADAPLRVKPPADLSMSRNAAAVPPSELARVQTEASEGARIAALRAGLDAPPKPSAPPQRKHKSAPLPPRQQKKLTKEETEALQREIDRKEQEMDDALARQVEVYSNERRAIEARRAANEPVDPANIRVEQDAKFVWTDQPDDEDQQLAKRLVEVTMPSVPEDLPYYYETRYEPVKQGSRNAAGVIISAPVGEKRKRASMREQERIDEMRRSLNAPASRTYVAATPPPTRPQSTYVPKDGTYVATYRKELPLGGVATRVISAVAAPDAIRISPRDGDEEIVEVSEKDGTTLPRGSYAVTYAPNEGGNLLSRVTSGYQPRTVRLNTSAPDRPPATYAISYAPKGDALEDLSYRVSSPYTTTMTRIDARPTNRPPGTYEVSYGGRGSGPEDITYTLRGTRRRLPVEVVIRDRPRPRVEQIPDEDVIGALPIDYDQYSKQREKDERRARKEAFAKGVQVGLGAQNSPAPAAAAPPADPMSGLPDASGYLSFAQAGRNIISALEAGGLIASGLFGLAVGDGAPDDPEYFDVDDSVEVSQKAPRSSLPVVSNEDGRVRQNLGSPGQSSYVDRLRERATKKAFRTMLRSSRLRSHFGIQKADADIVDALIGRRAKTTKKPQSPRQVAAVRRVFTAAARNQAALNAAIKANFVLTGRGGGRPPKGLAEWFAAGNPRGVNAIDYRDDMKKDQMMAIGNLVGAQVKGMAESSVPELHAVRRLTARRIVTEPPRIRKWIDSYAGTKTTADRIRLSGNQVSDIQGNNYSN